MRHQLKRCRDSVPSVRTHNSLKHLPILVPTGPPRINGHRRRRKSGKELLAFWGCRIRIPPVLFATALPRYTSSTLGDRASSRYSSSCDHPDWATAGYSSSGGHPNWASATSLRVTNSASPDPVIEDRISLARRTAYSLMGTGFHGNNGISPQYSVHIYMTYVIPRLMYGLEAVTLKSKHITSLESFHRKTIRELQSLSLRTAKEAVYLLSGIPPLECILDSSIATLHIQIGRDQQHPLTKSGLIQLSTKHLQSNSWFIYSARRLSRYGISTTELLLNKIKKSTAKNIILDYWLCQLKQDASTRSSLLHLCLASCSLSKCHSVWQNLECNLSEVKKAMTKAKLLVGAYTLQTPPAAATRPQDAAQRHPTAASKILSKLATRQTNCHPPEPPVITPPEHD